MIVHPQSIFSCGKVRLALNRRFTGLIAFFMEPRDAAKDELIKLREEVSYYRSILFSDFSIKNISILNALRVAANLNHKESPLAVGREVIMLEEFCRRLENENSILKSVSP